MPRTVVIRRGSVRVRIFSNPVCHVVDGESRTYRRWEVRWTDLGGKRWRIKRSSLKEARAEAVAKAEEIARGGATTSLCLADVASFQAGLVNLHGTGKTIEMATAEIAEACRLAPGVPMPELARFYVAHKPRTMVDLTVADCVAAVITTRAQQGLSAEWQRTLKGQLERFSADHPGPISAVTATAVQRWHLGLRIVRKKGTSPMHARTKNNHLAAVQQLFNAPALRSHSERQAIQDLPPIQLTASENAIWKPAEFQSLLETALLPFRIHSGRTRREEPRSHEHLIPVLVLGGFARLRSSEIRRIRWEKIFLDDKRLLLRAGQTKTQRTRIVELPDCAVAWLRLCAQKEGKVWPWASFKFNKDLRALAKRCQLQWRDNALRKSAVTYDQIRSPDLARVAREAGNSPTVLETEYLALEGITKSDAEAWFSILPPRRDRVIVALG